MKYAKGFTESGVHSRTPLRVRVASRDSATVAGIPCESDSDHRSAVDDVVHGENLVKISNFF